MKRQIIACITYFTACAFAFSPAAYADDARLLSMMNDLQQQMSQMQSTIDSQNIRIRELEGTTAGRQIRGSQETVYLPEGPREVPTWTEGLKWGGNLRLRYEGIDFSAGEQAKGNRDTNRFRYQLRWGFEKQMYDDLKLGFRLASGSAAGPTSTNDTFDTAFNKKLVWIDLVYATYTPEYAEGLQITAGKFKNPFVTSDILWDSDINLEGAYETYSHSFFAGRFTPFLTLGQLVVQEDGAGAPGDAELMVYQVGTTWRAVKDFMNGQPLDIKVAASYYDFSDYSLAGVFQAAGGNPTLPGGNLAAEDFDLGDIYVEAKLTPLAIGDAKVPVKLFTHLVRNLANDAFPTATTTADDYEYAYSYGLQIGEVKKSGDWKTQWRYSYIGPNSVPGGLADADFGGANRRGIEGILTYRLRDNLDLELTGNISGNVTGVDTEQRMFHTDLKWKF